MKGSNPLPPRLARRIQSHLNFLYGRGQGTTCYQELEGLLSQFLHRNRGKLPPAGRLGPADAILITYGDQVREPDRLPLQSLTEFLYRQVKGAITGVHLLPFFPYSSDDGFSVIDYYQIDATLGGWDDVARLGVEFDLMFDAVINHISSQSEWFQRYLEDDPAYTGFFITGTPGTDLSQVTRPRARPLLTPV